MHREGCMGLPSTYPPAAPWDGLLVSRSPRVSPTTCLFTLARTPQIPAKPCQGLPRPVPALGEVRSPSTAATPTLAALLQGHGTARGVFDKPRPSQGSVDTLVEATWVEDRSWQLECHSTSPAPHWDKPTAGFRVHVGCIGSWRGCVVWRCLWVCATCLCPPVACRYTRARTEPWGRERSGVKGVG